MHTKRGRVDHLAGCAWFWVWAVVGFGVALGLISALGPLVLLPAALVAIALLSTRRPRESVFGLVTGAGLLASRGSSAAARARCAGRTAVPAAAIST